MTQKMDSAAVATTFDELVEMDSAAVEKTFEELVEICMGDASKEKTESCPEAVRANSATDETLLHRICYSDKVTLDTVKSLVELYPEAVKHRSDYGWLPVHRACLNVSCPPPVIKFLVSQYPESLAVCWPIKGLPLHCLVGRPPYKIDDDDDDSFEPGEKIPLDLDLVKFMVEAYPEALTNQDNCESCTPLLEACGRFDVSLELVKLLVDKERSALTLAGPHGGRVVQPLEKMLDAARTTLPLNVVQFFVEAVPPDTLAPAFHAACKSTHVTCDMVKLFVEKRRELLMQLSRESGNLPLHSYCMNDHCSIEIVKYLVGEFPRAVRICNDYGLLPLAYSTKSFSVTKFLVEMFPESVTQLDGSGKLLFHSACGYGNLETVKYLFHLHPECVKSRTRSGQLPLHIASKSHDGQDAVEVINFLLKKHPEALMAFDVNGCLPFHLACGTPFMTDNSLPIIKALFVAYPQAIHTLDPYGRLPVHLACSSTTGIHNPSKEIIRFLATQLPYGLQSPDAVGKVPAHYACETSSLENLKFVVDLNPDAVKTESPKHGLVIHHACKHGADLEVVKYLESLYPESLKVQNESVGFPLHCARDRDVFLYLFFKRYEDTDTQRIRDNPLHLLLQDQFIDNKSLVAQRFINFCPIHTHDLDEQGAFPLHLAVTTSVNDSFIERLITLNPAAVKRQDFQGALPLHYALSHNAPLQLVTRLLVAHPDGIKVVNHEGFAPLHVACCHGSPRDVVEHLFKADPHQLHSTDHQGRTPLHVACQYGSSLGVVEFLVEADMSALRLTEDNEEMPLHKACRGGHNDVIKFIYEKHKPAVSARNASGVLPVFLLSQSSRERCHDKESAEFVEMIWSLLEAHPEAIYDALCP